MIVKLGMKFWHKSDKQVNKKKIIRYKGAIRNNYFKIPKKLWKYFSYIWSIKLKYKL